MFSIISKYSSSIYNNEFSLYNTLQKSNQLQILYTPKIIPAKGLQVSRLVDLDASLPRTLKEKENIKMQIVFGSKNSEENVDMSYWPFKVLRHYEIYIFLKLR
jgi:hypothetical protein